MRKIVFLTSMTLVFILNLSGAFYQDLPMTITQPDGSVFECFATGDEYFNYLHDENEFTIIQSPQDGFYYYAETINEEIVPSEYRVGSDDPANTELRRRALISTDQYKAKKSSRDNTVRDGGRAPHFGDLVNIVVYIRFSDQSEFTNTREFFDLKFNNDVPGESSVHNYYQEASYQNLDVESHHFPVCETDINLSYQDPNPRGYYSPYNYVTNPIGYNGNTEYTSREHTLLANAVAFIESEVPDSLELDGDNDNRLDSICFIIRGGNDSWADLLWAHRWALFSQNVFLHGKRVYDYTFQPESQNSISTLCHELFHLLGAPDLYHYNSDGFNPAGPWDIMDGSYTHMTAYMKYRYGLWIEDIPEITQSGTYYLNPLTEPDNNCYKVTSSHSNSEYFVLEYRKQVPGTVEMNVPGSGLLISRVNTNLDGQGNASGPPDELYIYRPGGTPNTNGDLQSAYFSAQSNRTEFSDATDPCDFFSNGTLGGIVIGSVGTAGDQISFILNPQNSFLMGNISSDNPEVNIMDASISLNGMNYEVLEGGDYFVTYMEGTYELEVSLEGHGTITQDVTLLPGEITTANIELLYLEPPFGLNYEYDSEAQEVTLTWDFDNFDDPEFVCFNVYMSINGNFYQDLGPCDGTTYVRPLMPVINMFYAVDAEYTNGVSSKSESVLVEFTPSNDTDIPPVETILYSNYPNPFNPNTSIRFDLSQNGPVSLSVYNTKGQLVKTLLNEFKNAGSYTLVWDGTNNEGLQESSGIYFYKLHYQKKQMNKKMIMIK